MAVCDSTSLSSVEKAFIENAIVSDVLKVSPKNDVNVSFKLTLIFNKLTLYYDFARFHIQVA